MPLDLRGLIPAPFTPMRPDGTIAYDVVDRYAEYLRSQRVAGVFVCGTTGEGPSLTGDERRQLVERWCEAAAGSLRVIVHVGHASVEEARALTEHAHHCGAAAAAALPPYYFKPGNVEDLVACCARIASGAPELPFFYYHLPDLTGVRLSMYEFLEKAEGRIPNLAGLKFSDADLMDFGRCLSFSSGRFDVLFGRDEMLLSAAAIGARGFVGSSYNFSAPLHRRIIDAFAEGDVAAARSGQEKSREVAALLQKFGGLAAGKAAMKLVGLDCGPVRLPLRSITNADFEAMRPLLASLLAHDSSE